MITVFAEPVTKDYYAHICSLSNTIYVFFILFCIIFPFLAAFASERFWVRDTYHYETPILIYNNEIQIFALRNNKTYFYSTMEQLNDYYPRQLISPSISYFTKDSNNDGINEQVSLQIRLPKENNNIKNLKIAVFFDYGFNVSFYFLICRIR